MLKVLTIFFIIFGILKQAASDTCANMATVLSGGTDDGNYAYMYYPNNSTSILSKNLATGDSMGIWLQVINPTTLVAGA